MRLKMLLTMMALAAILTTPVLAQTQAQTQDGSTVVVFAGDPFITGSVVGFTTVNEKVGADLANGSFIDVRVCNRGNVFAIERLAASGEIIANTLVRTRAGIMTLAEVASRLENACASGKISQVAAALGANAAITASMQTGATTHVFLMTSGEGGVRHIVAVNDLGTPVSADLTGITFVRLQMGTAGHVFAVAQLPAAGQPIANALVSVNGGTMTLADAAARLDAAHRGDTNLVLFTTGPTSDAVLVGMTPIGSVDLAGNVNFSGATNATVLINGQQRVFVITNSTLDTFGNINVRTEGDSRLSGRLFIEVIPALEVTL